MASKAPPLGPDRPTPVAQARPPAGWDNTPLGPRAAWPAGLRAAADLVLASGSPMAVVWGPDHRVFGNSAFFTWIGAQAEPGSPLPALFPALGGSVLAALSQTRLGQSASLLLDPDALPPDRQMILGPLCDDAGDVAGALITCWSNPNATQQQTVLRDSAAYRTLFESIDQGFCLAQIVLGPDNQPCDYRFLEANSAFLHHTGFTDPVGHTAMELVPGLERWWIDTYAEVTRTGKSVRLDYEAKPIGRHFDIFATRVGPEGSQLFAVVFRDITEQRAQAVALRESNARQAFLLALSDCICAGGDPEDMPPMVLGLLRDHLGVDRVSCFDQSEDETIVVHCGGKDGTQSHGQDANRLFGRSVADTFAKATLVSCDDTHADETLSAQAATALSQTQVRAFVGAAYVRGGRAVGGLAIHCADPRAWTKTDLTLIAEAAQRICPAIEQARTQAALRKSEARQAFLLSLADALRLSATPLAAQKEACRLLAGHLQVDRAFLAELDEPMGQVHIAQDHFPAPLQSVAGSYRAESFGLAMALLRKGERFVVSDMHSHDALPAFVRTRFLSGQIAACLCVPVIIGGRIAGAVCVTTGNARSWSDAESELLAEVGQRVWAAVAQTRSEIAQRAIDTRFRTLVEGMPQLVWRASSNGRWTWASPQWTGFTGLSDTQSQGAGWLEAVHPDDRAVTEIAWSHARELGRLEVDYRLRDHVTGAYRWFQTRALPVRDAAGQLVEWLGTSTDVQDLHDMHERLRTLVAELQHRTRNLMAVVTAVTDRTLAASTSLEEFGPLIQSRLGSIARTSGLLSKLSDDGQITFDELLESVFTGNGIEMFGTPRLSVRGPSGIRLRSSSVQTLALALHELAAQSLARGGLSQAGGHLEVIWKVTQAAGNQQRLTLSWSEILAEAETTKDRRMADGRAFGREMIERALPYQFNAETEYSVSADRLFCRVILPLGGPESGGEDADVF